MIEQVNNTNTLQSIYNQITNILIDNNVIMNITPPRPYLIFEKDMEECEGLSNLLKSKKITIEEYNAKMEEMNNRKLYFDEAYKFKNFN